MRHIILLQEGIRIFLRRIKVGFKGIKRYDGNVEKILTKVIEDCWNKDKEYFMVSPGHFREFYTRDFGWCCKALIGLGHNANKVVRFYPAVDGRTEKGILILVRTVKKGQTITRRDMEEHLLGSVARVNRRISEIEG